MRYLLASMVVVSRMIFFIPTEKEISPASATDGSLPLMRVVPLNPAAGLMTGGFRVSVRFEQKEKQVLECHLTLAGFPMSIVSVRRLIVL